MGGRPPTVTDAEILRAVQTTFGPATAKEVSEQISINKSGTNKRLQELAESGKVHRKKVGANAVVYWISEQGHRELQSELGSTG